MGIPNSIQVILNQLMASPSQESIVQDIVLDCYQHSFRYWRKSQKTGRIRKNAGIKPAFFIMAKADQSSGTISSATMLMILISGLTAGPAVSL